MPQVETYEGLFYAANLGLVEIAQALLGKYKADALIEETWSNLWEHHLATCISEFQNMAPLCTSAITFHGAR